MISVMGNFDSVYTEKLHSYKAPINIIICSLFPQVVCYF